MGEMREYQHEVRTNETLKTQLPARSNGKYQVFDASVPLLSRSACILSHVLGCPIMKVPCRSLIFLPQRVT